MDLALLPLLDALLQEGSVTRAARRVGLSTPAASHALSRIRDALGDPLLVRSGRAMVPTPFAEAIRPRVRALMEEAERVLSPRRTFTPAEIDRAFVVHATDHVITVLGPALDAFCRAEAPRAALRFLPNAADDAAALRDGAADLAVGIYGALPSELRTRKLLTDRFVCVVREGHPRVGKRLSLDAYVALEHVQVAPRGKPGGYLDDQLAERGLSRRVARAVPFFLAGLMLVARTDYVLTISERVATTFAPLFGLRILEPPLPLRPYALSLLWHPRNDEDPAHRWLRDIFARAAQKAAPEVHERAHTRLEPRPAPRRRRA